MASTTFVTINGVNFTKRQHDALVIEALRVAEDEGYCDEAENILTKVGFNLPEREVEVTLKVKVLLTRGRSVSDLNAEDFYVEPTEPSSWQTNPRPQHIEDVLSKSIVK